MATTIKKPLPATARDDIQGAGEEIRGEWLKPGPPAPTVEGVLPMLGFAVFVMSNHDLLVSKFDGQKWLNHGPFPHPQKKDKGALE